MPPSKLKGQAAANPYSRFVKNSDASSSPKPPEDQDGTNSSPEAPLDEGEFETLVEAIRLLISFSEAAQKRAADDTKST